MTKINESAFPSSIMKECAPNCEYLSESEGLTKLEYAAIKIFCASLTNQDLVHFGIDVVLKKSVEQAKLLLQECEEEK